MSHTEQPDPDPSQDEMEALFVNNGKIARIQAYLDRFNPIRTMKMERMEIRHSAILSWLLDPKETHLLGDRFLKAFLGEALRGHSSLGTPTALHISRSDLRDAEIRCEWQNIDIFILSQNNNWAFIVENKFDSKQHEGQLAKYKSNVQSIYGARTKKLKIRGIFLTLWDEEPQDPSFSPIKYEQLCEMLDEILSQQPHNLSPEVAIFLTHYLDVLKDETGMSEELKEMAKLARQLYKDHKKALDFVWDHGASNDFGIAVHQLFGDDAEYPEIISIGKNEYAFNELSVDNVSFLPRSWFQALGGDDYHWPGCENYWASFPLIVWIQIIDSSDGLKGHLRLHAEIGPITDHEFRKSLIESIQKLSEEKDLPRIRFQRGAAEEGKKYSKFLKKNTIEIKDSHDSEEISAAMVKLLERFQPEFGAIAEVLPQFMEYGSAIKQ